MSKMLVIDAQSYKVLQQALPGMTITTFVHSHTKLEGTAQVTAGGNRKPVSCNVSLVERRTNARRGAKPKRTKILLTRK
jgi:hypothetical protein